MSDSTKKPSLSLESGNDLSRDADLEAIVVVSQKPNELPEPVYLCSPKATSGFIHEFIERFVFFKTEEFKNNPRVNKLLYRAINSVTVVSLICGIMGWAIYGYQIAIASLLEMQGPQLSTIFRFSNAVKFTLSYVGAISFLFWRSRDLFHQQWTYCSNLYNDCVRESDPDVRQVLRVSLAIDLIVVDLWAHRSFDGLFRTELWKALCDRYSSEPGALADATDRIKRSIYSEEDARAVLEFYQANLMHRKKMPKITSPKAG